MSTPEPVDGPQPPQDAQVSIPRPWLDLLKSAARTAAAPLVAFLVGWLRSRGVAIPEWGGTYAVPVLVGAVYYVVARLAEVKLDPRWGVLLLAVGKPVYETATQALDKSTVPVLAELPADPPPYTGPWPPLEG